MTVFKFNNLSFQSSFSLLLAAGMILFGSELISKSCSINHGFLCLLLRVLCLLEHIIDFCVHAVDGRFAGSLLRCSLGVDCHACLSKFHFGLFLATVSGVQKRARFL